MAYLRLTPLKKVAILLETKEEREKILTLFEENSWLNINGKKPTEFIYSKDWKNDDCVSAGVDAMGAERYFGFESKKWYEENGYQVISAPEFLEGQIFSLFIDDLDEIEKLLDTKMKVLFLENNYELIKK